VKPARHIELPIKLLVPGDVILLSAGDMIPADCRVLSAKDLFVSQAAMAGESLPVEKFAEQRDRSVANPLELENILFMGTTVVSGSATVVILTTGNRTCFGVLAQGVTTTDHAPTQFQIGVNRVSWLLIRFMLVMAPLVLVINVATKHDWLETVLFALAVAVGLTPEMLPMIVTSTLAKGAVMMSRRKVIVKRLDAIQDFGAMNVLCTDKTGTLTQDKIFLERRTDVWGETSDAVLEYAYFITIVCANRPPRAGRGSTAAVLRHTRGFSLSVSTVGDQSPMRAARCGRFRSSLQGLTATSSTRRPATHQFAKFRVKPCSGGT
jgi:Mg2+-importing ATPase